MTDLPEHEAPVPPRVMREVERILDGVAKRLFLERLSRANQRTSKDGEK